MPTRKKFPKKTRTKYPDKYKAEAVMLTESIGTTAAKGSGDSNHPDLRLEKQAAKTEIENCLLAENAELKREVVEQKKELSLLNKALAYVCHEHG